MSMKIDGTVGITFPDGTIQTTAATGGGGGVSSVSAAAPLASSGGATPVISLTGVVPVANGGTGSTTVPPAGGVAYGTGTALGFTAVGALGDVLTSSGTGTPTWTAQSALTIGNLAGGLAGQIPYQTGPGTTSFIAAPTTASTFLQWDGTTYTWASAASAGINSDITSLTGLTGGISTPTFVQFDTTATYANALGKLMWDSTNQCLSYGIATPNLDLQVGQQNVVLVKNGTGATIPAGSVVYTTGSDGTNITVALAQANAEATSAPTLGVTSQSIASGATGFVCTFGQVHGLNTNAFNAGDTIYLSPTVAGGVTTTEPIAPNHIVMLGWVTKKSAGNGEFFISINNGWELNELHNVQISSPVAGNTLIYDAATQVWKNANLTAGAGISITQGNASIVIASNGSATNISGGTANQLVYQTGVGATSFIAAPTVASTFLQWNGTGFVWASPAGAGTVTSVNVEGGTTGLTFTGGPITSAGTITMGGVLDVANGGTGSTTSIITASSVVTAADAGKAPIIDGTGKLDISTIPLGVVKSVNAVNPDSAGNVVLSLTATQAGTLAARPAAPADGTIYVVAGDPTPGNNGKTYVYVTANAAWYQVSSFDTAFNDARYAQLAGATMTGNLVLAGDPTAALQAATKQYVDNNFLPLTGGTLTGALTGTTITATRYVGVYGGQF